MGHIYARGNTLWLCYRGVDGKRRRHPTDFKIGEEAKAGALLRRTEQKIAAERALAFPDAVPPTVKVWADRWLEERKALVAGWKTDKGRVERHILPELGPLHLVDVRPRHLIALVRGLRSKGKLAPKTIRSVYACLCAMFRDAVRAELLDTSPCVLTRQDLGPASDKNPEWRPTAIYSRAELETLTSDERIPADRRVLCALEGVAALRHGEAAGLRWRHYEADAEPLGRLGVSTSYDKGRTKTSRPRQMPVHPTLAAILAEWRLEGWPAMFGRKPDPDDLILPVAPGGKATAGEMRKPQNSWLALQRDLDDLGMRRRRAHDLRRTFISLARADGARPDILKTCTHGPSGQMIDLYTSLEWPVLCAEVSKLRVRRRVAAEVVQLSAAGGGPGRRVWPQGQPQASHSGQEVPGTIAAFLASPTGFEPVSPA
jgi:integrase